MPISSAGRDHLVQAGIGAAVIPFDEANAHIGVGDSTAVFDATQTDLQAATNKVRKLVDAGYPTGAANVLNFKATFGPDEANFDWNEWGVFNAASGGTMLNRKVEGLGTKVNTQTWEFTTTITLSTS